MKPITLNFEGFYIRGVADVTPWLGGRGHIEMAPFRVKHLKEIKDGINDNGFGVASINGAYCDIYKMYTGGYVIYGRSVVVGDVSDGTLDAVHELF